jgi:DNA-binding transcriptional ArsR family regulator
VSEGLDRTFHALSDASRRAMVERLSRGPASVSELAEPFTMALPAVMKHLAVLEEGGLVRSDKRGRVRTYRIETAALARVEHWVTQRQNSWHERFDRLERMLDKPTRGKK